MQLVELNMQYDDVIVNCCWNFLYNTHLRSKINTRQAANMTKIGFV